ncbi:hypothetical protein M409DRAFT_18589 [Zasmidium cellare ATCC 36951]|uniref:Uncharacterized protein n=1 Tax=Zasmidium cellare ATCC 36951 TaxID=1080233 RepID=A0A6A6CZZ1_ZASCE|nr:uncharacterized protein M409DRAFT_18589 [Zasmidium cellare ATCC 36951]KAF2171472.1 hypothetical protein M409DRAFT_18589 [Zasmidium cellare ATCC 36951]
MSEFILSIVVYGPGTDPNHRSHWTLAIHRRNDEYGVLLHVNVIDLSRLIYQFDIRRDVLLHSRSSEGSFVVAQLGQNTIRRVIALISEEPAPRDGVERCQDWVLRAMISLEAEEIVPAGTSEWVSRLIGHSAEEVARAVSTRWSSTEA